MSDLVKSPMQYLDKATSALRDLGIVPPKAEDAPINALLEQISDLEPDKIAVIARTLSQAERVQRGRARADRGHGRSASATRRSPTSFNSIRDDAKAMVDQIDDGKLDLFERVTNVWMKICARRHRRPLRQDQGHLSRRLRARPRTRSSASASSSRPTATSAAR